MFRTKSLLLSTAALTAFALVAPARAEVVLLGDDPQGWVFSTDGFLNAFAISASTDAMPGTTGGKTRGTPAYSIGSTAGNSSHITNGLMPESFGFNVKSPDLDGNKMTARLSIQTGMSGVDKTWDTDGASTPGSTPSLLREAYMTYGGTWGEFQAGKSLGIFGSQAILNDMYLFGVGGGVASQGNGQNAAHTTTGGIGYGYTYAGWNGNIRYTTPALGGFKATVGIFEPNSIQSYDPLAATVTADRTHTPRVEGGVNYAGKAGDTTLTGWLNGTYQDASVSSGTYGGKNVAVYGGEMGGRILYGPWDFVAHGYVGPGLGLSGAQLSFDSLDATGEEVLGYGYYVQGQYHFGQGTSIAARYGSSFIDETAYQKSSNGIALTEKDLAGAQVYHMINKYFRVVGEYDYVTNQWADGASQHEHVAAIGVVATY